MPVHVLVACVDMRGCTAWANQVAAVPALEPLVEGLYAACAAVLPQAWCKLLGDGALLIVEQDAPTTPGATLDLQQKLLTRVDQIDAAWYQHRLTMSQQYGLDVNLSLGWGLARGVVAHLARRDDYLGLPVSLACRLCSLARPSGVALDASTFPGDPNGFSPRGWQQVLLPVKGWAAPYPVWISREVERVRR